MLINKQVTNLLDGYHELFDQNYDKIITNKYNQLEMLYQRIIKRPKINKLLQQQSIQKCVWFDQNHDTLKQRCQQLL